MQYTSNIMYLKQNLYTLEADKQLKKCQHKTININRVMINRTSKVKYLRSYLDEQLKFKHASKI